MVMMWTLIQKSQLSNDEWSVTCSFSFSNFFFSTLEMCAQNHTSLYTLQFIKKKKKKIKRGKKQTSTKTIKKEIAQLFGQAPLLTQHPPPTNTPTQTEAPRTSLWVIPVALTHWLTQGWWRMYFCVRSYPEDCRAMSVRVWNQSAQMTVVSKNQNGTIASCAYPNSGDNKP